MSRRKKVIEEAIEDGIQDARVIMRWSTKRIVVATTLVIVIILGGLYAISLMSQNPTRVLGEKTSDRPQIKIPTEKTVDEVIEKAKEDLANINAKNIISSQPKIQKIINDLTALTGSSVSAKSVICDALCK